MDVKRVVNVPVTECQDLIAESSTFVRVATLKPLVHPDSRAISFSTYLEVAHLSQEVPLVLSSLIEHPHVWLYGEDEAILTAQIAPNVQAHNIIYEGPEDLVLLGLN